uniref:PB2 n=2 Tax=root TaxID=1 RepID=A0A3G1PW33_9ORTO|nr:PB2 [Photinus pyralis orthomyxo-like virus 1]
MEPERKKLFLECLRKIVKAKHQSVNIMRSYNMNNMKLIERSSRCIKDPNPLASTMSTLSQKYPITVDSQRYKEYKVPNEYIYKRGRKNEEEVDDSHRHNRVLCKKEAVDWWVSASPVPEPDTVALINILFEQPRKEVKDYYSMRWGDTRVRFGRPNLERSSVSTKKPVIEVDRSIRKTLLKTALFPHLCSPAERVPREDLEKMEKLMKLRLTTKMSLPRQIRILMCSMDPHRRVLPVIPGTMDLLAPMVHALRHNNFVITGYSMPDVKSSLDIGRHLTAFGKCLIISARENNLPISTVKEIIQTSSIGQRKMERILKVETLQETNEIKWMKTACNIPITPESTNAGLTTCPRPVKVTAVSSRNAAGVPFTVYHGREKIDFKYGDIKGTFEHNGPMILSITSNYTDYTEIIKAIAEMGVYCRWEFDSTTDRSYTQIKETVRQLIQRNPENVIACKRGDLTKLHYVNNFPFRVGILNLLSNTEYHPSPSLGHYIGNDYNIYLKDTNQCLTISSEARKMTTLGEVVDCRHPSMLHFMSFKLTIETLVQFYLNNWKLLIESIRAKKMNWRNEAVCKHMGNQAYNFSRTCRVIINNLMEKNSKDYASLSLLYCFCFPEPGHSAYSPTLLKLKNGYVIDLSAKTGVFQFNQELSQYELFQKKIRIEGTSLDLSENLKGLLPGFSLVVGHDEKLDRRTMNQLLEDRHLISHGTSFTTNISGELFIATRDINIEDQTFLTINRQMRNYEAADTSDDIVLNILKRKAQVGATANTSEEKDPKKPRLEASAEEEEGFELINDSEEEEEIDMDVF